MFLVFYAAASSPVQVPRLLGLVFYVEASLPSRVVVAVVEFLQFLARARSSSVSSRPSAMSSASSSSSLASSSLVSSPAEESSVVAMDPS